MTDFHPTQTLDGASLRHPRIDDLRMIALAGPDVGRQFPLAAGHHVIGTSDDCHIVLADPTVSRAHLELVVDRGHVEARDLGSRNGSYFNGARFGSLRLAVSSVITIGRTALKIVTSDHIDSVLPSQVDHFGGMLGGSLAMRSLYAVLERVAASDLPILIEGESGTGKEVCANALHRRGPRNGKPFVVCDVSHMMPSLIESELFGHVRGAFTGADRTREGTFSLADGGTIFIDEIGELQPELQPRLLRVLEQRQFRPVGGQSYRSVDVRIIAATNRNLREEVRRGRFREDLYHRLAVFSVSLPPLRDRKEDLPQLVAAWCGEDITIPDETMAILLQHDWPGNVRELRNVVDRAKALMGPSRVLHPSTLGLRTLPGASLPAAARSNEGLEPFYRAKDRLIADWERGYLDELIGRCDGNVARAAREGGIDRVHLYRLLKKHGIGGAAPRT